MSGGQTWDTELEQMAKTCGTCSSLRRQLPETPLHPWARTSRPMERTDVDFCDFKTSHSWYWWTTTVSGWKWYQ